MSDKVLWGLWYAKEQGEPDGGRWYLDYFGRPCFSYDRRLVAAHVAARNVRDEAVGRFFVYQILPNGRPLFTGEPHAAGVSDTCDCIYCTASNIAQALAAQADMRLNGTGEGVPTGILNLDEDEHLKGKK